MSPANLIVVGGPISVGKSTLITSLPFPHINELNELDNIQALLLENTYIKGRVAPETIEHYFLQVRAKNYAKFSNKAQLHLLDRSILESLWFAKGNMSRSSFAHFKKQWESTINELFEIHGKPKLYILLTMNWDTFKKRIFKRGREVEIKNFTKNEEFFRKHIDEYESHMINIFKTFDINYRRLATDNLNQDDVLTKTLELVSNA